MGFLIVLFYILLIPFIFFIFYLLAYLNVYRAEIYSYRYLFFSILTGLSSLFFLRVFFLSRSKKNESNEPPKVKVSTEYRPKAPKPVIDEEKMKEMDDFELRDLEKQVENDMGMKPVENLDFEEFAKHAANLMDNPSKYSDFVTGWFFRGQAKRAAKGVEEITNYLDKMRMAASSARELQTELLKNKYLLRYQALIAIQSARTEYKEKIDEAELRAIAREAEKSRLRFIAEFYKNANSKDLTPSERMLYLSQTPIIELNSASSNHSASEKVFANPSDVLKIEKENQLLKMIIQERQAEYAEKIKKNEILEEERRSKKAQADLDEDTARREIGEDSDSETGTSDSKKG